MTLPIDLVVVTYNSEQFVPRLAASLGAALVQSIVVVDNSPSDAVQSAIASTFWEVAPQVVRRPDNPGFGAAMNDGVSRGTAPFVGLINPDVIVDGLTLESLLAELRGHSGAGVVGAQLLTSTGQPVSSARDFPTLSSVARIRPTEVAHGGTTAPADWICGALMLWRREDFERLGGFDERYFLYYEDVDICRRAREAGIGVIVAGGITVIHDQGHGVPTSRHLIKVNRRSRRVYATRWLGVAGVVAAAAATLRESARSALRTMLGRRRR